MKSCVTQSTAGAEAYDHACRTIQSEHFKFMTSSIHVKSGWKILDVGCGTGCDTASLLSLVGKDGHVIGIDPISERIKIAVRNYQNDGMKFHVALGNEASDFGKDFDLVVSSQVLHWIPTDKKPATFQSIANSLKPGSEFVYLIGRTDSNPDSKLIKLDSLMPKCIQDNFTVFYFESKETLEKMALENGFSHVTVEEAFLHTTFNTVLEYLTWVAATLQTYDFEMMMKSFKQILNDNDVTFMYNSEGKVDMKCAVHLAKCRL